MNGTYSFTAATDGQVFSQNFTDQGAGGQKRSPTPTPGTPAPLPLGLAVSNIAWGASSAVLTVATGHGITTANLVALLWSGGCRFDLVVSATTSTSITVTNSTGAGTSLPTSSTATGTVSIATPVSDAAFTMVATTTGTGSDANFLLITSDQQALLSFLNGGGTSLWAGAPVLAAGGGYCWSRSSGTTIPFIGTVASLNGYNFCTTAGANLVMSVVQNT